MKKILQIFIIVSISLVSTIAHSGCDKEYDQYYNSAKKLYDFSHQAISTMTKAPGTFNLASGDWIVHETIAAKNKFFNCIKNNNLWSITSALKGPKLRKMAKAAAAEHKKAKALYFSQK